VRGHAGVQGLDLGGRRIREDGLVRGRDDALGRQRESFRFPETDSTIVARGVKLEASETCVFALAMSVKHVLPDKLIKIIMIDPWPLARIYRHHVR